MSKVLSDILFRVRVLMSNPYKLPGLYRQRYRMDIGAHCVFTGKNISFGSEPYLIKIGNGVRIAADVKFLTHDGAVGIFRNEFPGLNVFDRITIGNDVFIGSNSVILPGVTIGNNVVIGAGSVVTKDVKDNCVAAGVPCRVLSSINEYKTRILKRSIRLTETEPDVRRKLILEHLG